MKATQDKLEFIPVRNMADNPIRKINVERNGKPFGQLWTFKTAGETHPWHASTLSGHYRFFHKEDGGFEAAKEYLERQAQAL